MKQHTVPQNIMSVEFKIIGDLSIRQFIYVTISGGIAFILYLIGLPTVVKIPLIILDVLIGLAVTLGKVNERPFDVWVSNFVTAVLLPTQRVWRKRSDIPPYLLEEALVQQANRKSKSDEGYAKVISYIHSKNLPTDEVRQSNTKLDIEEIKFLSGVDKLFTQSSPNTNQSSDDILTGIATKTKDNTQFSEMTNSTTQNVSNIPNREDPKSVNNLAKNNTSVDPIVAPTIDQLTIKPEEETINGLPQHDNIVRDEEKEPVIAGKSVANNMDLNFMTNDNQNNYVVPPITDDSVPPVIPFTPSGASEELDTGMVMDPIVDEKKESVSNTFTIEPDTVVKLDDLKSLTSSPLDTLDNALKSIDVPLGEDVEVLKSTPRIVNKPSVNEVSNTQKPNGIINELEEENRLLREQIELMKLKAEPVVPTVPVQTGEGTSENEHTDSDGNAHTSDDKMIFGHMPDFTRYPNIVNGVVVDTAGKYIEDVVVIIKDKSHRIMRAMKTNIVGQFYSRNPLINGLYSIEANKEGLVFEAASVELKGDTVNPLLIKPKKFSGNDGNVNLLS